MDDNDNVDKGGEDSDGSEEETVAKGSGKGRRKISIEFIEDRSRRHITFSKRKAGIMKKAYELSTLTGTQVLLLVASETGHVYTFATSKLQPLITKPEGKNLIQTCLNAQETPVAPSSIPVITPTGSSHMVGFNNPNNIGNVGNNGSNINSSNGSNNSISSSNSSSSSSSSSNINNSSNNNINPNNNNNSNNVSGGLIANASSVRGNMLKQDQSLQQPSMHSNSSSGGMLNPNGPLQLMPMSNGMPLPLNANLMMMNPNQSHLLYHPPSEHDGNFHPGHYPYSSQ